MNTDLTSDVSLSSVRCDIIKTEKPRDDPYGVLPTTVVARVTTGDGDLADLVTRG